MEKENKPLPISITVDKKTIKRLELLSKNYQTNRSHIVRIAVGLMADNLGIKE